MTLDISATSPRVQYTVGGSSTTTFAYGFPIFQEADLKVYVDSTLKTLTTHYSITGEGTTSGGNVVFGTGVTNCTVTIFRDVEIARTTDFPTSGAFQVGSLNTELDTITAVQQELEDKITRSLRLDDEDGAVAMTLPLKANRIGKILGFNSSTGVPESYVYLTNENTVALDGLTAGTVTESKYVLVDSNKDIGTFRNITLSGELDAGSLDVSGNADIDGTLEADAITVDGTALNEYIADTVGAMVGSNTETGITVSYEDGDNTLDFALGASQTTITSLLATDIKIGEDDQTKIDFETADTIHFYAGNENQLILTDGALTPASNAIVDLGTDALEFKDAYFDGTLEADAITIGGTAIGSIYGVVAGSSSIVTTGALNSGSITSGFGTIDTGSSAITTTGLISGGSLDIDNVLINGTTIGHTDDTDLITLADGVVTVAGEISVTTLDIGGTNVTSTAAELNVLDGIASIDTDISSVSGSDDTLASAKAIKTYVDAKVTAEDLDVTSDSGTIAIDLDSETLTIAGGTGLASSASSNTVTLAVDAAQTGITSILATDVKIGEDDQTKVDFETANQINFYADNTKRVTIDATGLTVNSGSIETATIDYTDGDLAMTIADGGAVTFAQVPVFPDDTIETADIQDNAVTLAKMAGLARGKLITGDSSGDPSALTIGSNGQYLKSDGSDLVWGSATVSGLACDDLTVGDSAVTLSTSAGDITIDAQGNDTDIIFKGTDNTSDITMLTLDGSDAGTATFNSKINAGDDVTITSTDAGSGEDPNLIFYRNSSSPADWDELGTINFRGRNDNSQDVEYAQINAVIEDMTDGTENGRISFETMLSGTLTQTMYMDSWGNLHFMGDSASLVWHDQNGTTYDAYLDWADLTAQRNVLLPDADGTILVQDSNDDVIITSTDAGAGDDPSLILYRNSSSPADSDDIGEIIFRGRNDNSQDVEYTKIWTDAADVSDGTEDGKLKIEVMKAGTLTNKMDIRGTGKTTFNDSDIMLSNGVSLFFEGATDDAYELELTVTDPTADRVITLPDATGTVALQNASIDMNGTELILDADADTSITADSDDQIDFRIGGSDQHKFGSEVVFNEQGADINFRVEGSGDANLFKVDAGNDRVGIGGDPSVPFHVNTSSAGNYVAKFESSNEYGVNIKTSSTSASHEQLTITNGSDATVFKVTGGGETTIAGDIIFSGAGYGINLGVTSNTDSNTLDDYEEGTFTATPRGGDAGSGAYTKIGNLVTFTITVPSMGCTSNSNEFNVSGLPFTSANNSIDASVAIGTQYQVDLGDTGALRAKVGANGTSIFFYETRDDNTYVIPTQAAFDHADAWLLLSGSYIV